MEEQNNLTEITIYTDGACSGNPGKGGWGAILMYKNHKKPISGFEEHTTNNRMEMMAVIKSLEMLTKSCVVNLFTDSKYVANGITEWLSKWKKNNWKNSSKKPVENQDLWKRLDELLQQHQVKVNWVKGHAEDDLNNEVDMLARSAIL